MSATSSRNDTLDGDDGADRVVGGSGADVLSGGEGDDVLQGGAQHDVLHGDGGFDLADYPRAAPVIASIGDGANDGEAGEHDDIGADVEGIRGGSAADLMSCDAGANLLIGQGGSDTLTAAFDVAECVRCRVEPGVLVDERPQLCEARAHRSTFD